MGPKYEFNELGAMALGGRDLFVAGGDGSSVTEVDATTGALVTVISGSAYQFNGPEAMVLDGHDLFVANLDGDSVRELPV